MKPEPFVIERTIVAPIDRIWLAITNKEQMKQWYFDIAAFEPRVGFEFEFIGGDESQTFLHLCRIIEVLPLERLKHSWRYEGQKEETIVTWELTKAGTQTKVRLTHEGLDRIAPHGPAFAKENFAAGWTHIVGSSLKDFVTRI